MTAPADRIETETCGRCAGSGRYSYNQMHGSRCYGCGGSGKVFTKRGAAAHQWLEAIRSKRADAFVAGELVRYEMVSPYATARVWATVIAIEPTTMRSTVNGVAQETPMVTLTLRHKGGETRYTTSVDAQLRKGFDAETKQAQLRDAIAYQATLGRNGKPLRAAA